MQFTGLKDKDKAELYEDDIVELESEYDGSMQHEGDDAFHLKYTGTIKFMPSMGFYIKVSKTYDMDNMEYVIGPNYKTIVQYRTKKNRQYS